MSPLPAMKQDGGIYLLYHSGTKGSIMAAGGDYHGDKKTLSWQQKRPYHGSKLAADSIIME